LFDEYLKNQNELGSVVDTNAQIQYRAATGIQTTPKVSYVRMALKAFYLPGR